jgi:transposase-like protein
MQLHRNAKLGLSGRFALVKTIEGGCSLREAARRHGVSPASACEWWRRWREASERERETRACLHDRSSRPHRCPRMLSRPEQQRICALRRRTGWGPRLIAGTLGHPHATVSKTLKRNSCSRPQRPPREPANRYEWPGPGDLLHMDSTSYARFERPGHALGGDRSRGKGWMRPQDAGRLRLRSRGRRRQLAAQRTTVAPSWRAGDTIPLGRRVARHRSPRRRARQN